jgi:hypothetical protein
VEPAPPPPPPVEPAPPPPPPAPFTGRQVDNFFSIQNRNW